MKINIIHPKKQIVKRYAGNPVITKDMMPFSCRGVFNSSAVKHVGTYIMILRAEGYNLYDSFWLAHSNDGYEWTIGSQVPLPQSEDYPQEVTNQYDPRITKLGDTYYITFCVHPTTQDVRMGLMTTKDFKKFDWQGFITGVGFRNTVLFPEKINGLYTALERPNDTGDIWLTQSPDLKFWGQQKIVLRHGDVQWAWGKIGPCGTPIKTAKGWLSVFHGVQIACGTYHIYHTGIMLTELERPWKLIRIGNEPIMTPEQTTELIGHVPTVVFASSQIVEDDGSVKLYFGGSDTVQCVADTTIDLLLEAALTR